MTPTDPSIPASAADPIVQNPERYHDRLDMIRHIDAYSAPECGSVNPRTHQPDFCSFNCPTLKALHSGT